MTDPAPAEVVLSLLIGTGVAIGVVLLLLGVRWLIGLRARPQAVAEHPPVEVAPEAEPPAEQPAAAEPVEEEPALRG